MSTDVSASKRRAKFTARTEAQIRQLITAEAARIMAEEGARDFHAAKRKAIQRLSLPSNRNLPTNQEVESALREYLRLFHADRWNSDLRRLRQAASEAMGFLDKHEPRLVGPVLSGVVVPGSEIEIHLQADTPEEIALLLQANHIPFEPAERRLRFGGDRYDTLPSYRFLADNVIVELVVFDPRTIREPPLSPVDGKPMKRAHHKDVLALLTL
jgi:hypothetical protein